MADETRKCSKCGLPLKFGDKCTNCGTVTPKK